MKLKHDINDKDLKAFADIVAGATATINGMTITIERFRQLFEDALKRGVSFSLKVLGYKLVELEGGLK